MQKVDQCGMSPRLPEHRRAQILNRLEGQALQADGLRAGEQFRQGERVIVAEIGDDQPVVVGRQPDQALERG